MHTQTYKVKGMHCASCSSIIEKTFKKTDGVHSADVNYGTETAKVSFDESKTPPQSGRGMKMKPFDSQTPSGYFSPLFGNLAAGSTKLTIQRAGEVLGAKIKPPRRQKY